MESIKYYKRGDAMIDLIIENGKIVSHKKVIDSDEGYDVIHKILKFLVIKGNTNWYDLDLQEKLVKKYILYKLEKYI